MLGLSKGTSNAEVDDYSGPFTALVVAMMAETYRLFDWYNAHGHPPTGTTPSVGGGNSKPQWVDYPATLKTQHANAGLPQPYFHFEFPGHPPDLPSSYDYYNITDGQGYSSNVAVDGSTGMAKEWYAYWLALYGAFVLLVELWNEPATLGGAGHAGGNSGFWFADPNGSFKANAWANIHAKLFTDAMKTAAGYDATKNYIAHNAGGDGSFLNGTGDKDGDFVTSVSTDGNWPWGGNQVSVNGYTAASCHGYDHTNTGGGGTGNIQDVLNARFCPTVEAGTFRGGWLTCGDYIRAIVDAAGGTDKPLVMSEIEPAGSARGCSMPGGAGTTNWGKLGYGATNDAAMAVVCANRHVYHDYLTFEVMDAMGDELSQVGTANGVDGQGDCMLLRTNSTTFTRTPRYFAFRDIWGKFIRKYKLIVPVPMYSGDPYGVATWTVAPALSKASPTSSNYTLQAPRHQVVFGFDPSSAGQLSWGALLVDISDTVSDTGEELTLTPPPVAGTIMSVTAISMPRNWSTFHWTNGEPGSGLSFHADAGPAPVSVTGSPWSTITTGANGCPSFSPCSIMLLEAVVSPSGGGGGVARGGGSSRPTSRGRRRGR